MKIFIKRSIVIGVLLVIFSGIISCEKDFKDIGSSVINNTEFDTKDTILEVDVVTVPITSVRADGIALGGVLGQYLLGVYNNSNFEKIEAWIVSPLNLPTQLDVTTGLSDTTSIHTELDTVILRIPYQATLTSGTSGTKSVYKLDSVFGDISKSFALNVFETSTFLNTLNPNDPTKSNSYQSNASYTPKGNALNATLDYQFKPNASETYFVVNRKLKSGNKFNDTIRLSDNEPPFARIPLKKAKFLEFMSKYEDEEFATQDAFNNYFRGIIIEATGNEGSLISLSLSGQGVVAPSIELYYTNTVTSNKSNSVIDTIRKNDGFPLGGVRNSIYKMGTTPSISANQFPIQGTAGNMAKVTIFKDGLNGLRAKNWLINDASLTFYVDKSIGVANANETPSRLFLYKNPENPTPSIIKDLLTEGPDAFDGARKLSTDGTPDKYRFRITDYVSDLLNGTASNTTLALKAYNSNSTDIPSSVTDTIVETYNWNPKAVMLLNGTNANESRKAQLKISYTEKKN